MSDEHGFINILVQASDAGQTSNGGFSTYYVPLCGNYKITLKSLFVNAGHGSSAAFEVASPQLRNTMGPATQPYLTMIYPFNDYNKVTNSVEMGFYTAINAEVQIQFRNFSDHLPMTSFESAFIILEYEKM